jgi:integrase
VRTLSVLLNTAVDWGEIPASPASRLRLPKPPPRENPAKKILTPEQLEQLYAAAGDRRTETLLRTAAEAGLRSSELIGLQWRDVDADARRITVARTVYGTQREIHTPKSGRPGRVAITETLADQLAGYRAEAGASAEDWVWPGRDGRAMSPYSPGQLLERVMRRASLVEPILDANGVPVIDQRGRPITRPLITLQRPTPYRCKHRPSARRSADHRLPPAST